LKNITILKINSVLTKRLTMQQNTFIDEYNKYKHKMLEILTNLKQIALNEKMILISESIESASEKLNLNTFKIIVVGEFSRGKSAFINALLKKDILPSDIRPSTATLNIIKFSENEKVIIHYSDKTQKQMDLNSIKTFVVPHKKKNKDNDALNEIKLREKEIENLKFIEIFYHNDFVKNGVEIIDTPGVNDINQIREEITYKIIPKADAAILLLDPNQPFSGSEQSFLKEKIIKNDIKKIFFVVNKWDQIEEKDKTATLEHISKVASELVNNPKIYTVSSFLALEGYNNNDNNFIKESQINEFESDLLKFLTHEKGKLILSNPLGKAIKHANEILGSYMTQKNLIKYAEPEIEKKINMFESKARSAQTHKSILHNEVMTNFDNIKTYVQNYLRSELNILMNFFKENIPRWTIDPNNYENCMNEIDLWFSNNLKSFLKERIETAQNIISDEINKIYSTCNTKLYSINNEIRKFGDSFTEEIILDETILDVDNMEIEGELYNIGRSFSFKNQSSVGAGAVAGAMILGPVGFFLGAVLANELDNSNFINQLAQVQHSMLNHSVKIINNIIQHSINTVNRYINDNKNTCISYIDNYVDTCIESIKCSLDEVLRIKKMKEYKINEQNEIIQRNIQNINVLINELKQISFFVDSMTNL